MLIGRMIATSLAAIAVGAFVTGCGGAENGACDEVSWEQWRADPDDGSSPTPRQRIADTIISCDLLNGVGKKEVRARLGRPDSGPYKGRRWRWITGTARGTPIDSEELVVEFSGDRVRNVSLEAG